MKTLSWLIYQLLKLLSLGFLRVLYPAKKVEGLEHVKAKGPYILASNHPNTLIDPLMLGIHIPERLYFMANAGMFTHPVAHRILVFLGVIPIVRRGVDKNKRVNNNDSFEAAYQHFESGGIMFVAPEGGSELERRLRAPLKKGTARMAFTAEERNDWNLGLTIIPGVTNYEAPTQCYSRAFVRFGPSIRVADYRELYESEPRKAITDLTNEIGQRMAVMLIDTRDKAEEYLLRPLDRALQNDRPMPVDDHHFRLQKLLSGLRELPDAEREDLATKASRYETLLQKANITDEVASNAPAKAGSLGLWLGLPVFLWGALNHALLIWLASFAYRKSGVENNYAATVHGLVGVLALPIVYLLQTLVFSAIFPGGWGWLYLLTLPVFGLLALSYYTTYRPYWASRFKGQQLTDEMQTLRTELREKTDAVLAK